MDGHVERVTPEGVANSVTGRLLREAICSRRLDLHELAEPHGEAMMVEVQRELSSLEGERLSRSDAAYLSLALRAAVYALEATGRDLSKREQLRVSEGHPLAVCYGLRVISAQRSGWLAVRHYGLGCGLVFRDTVAISGRNVWAQLCLDCRGNLSSPKRAAMSRAVKKLRAEKTQALA
jgi:hypothetical protein